MKKYIKQKQLLDDTWHTLEVPAAQTSAVVPGTGRWIVSLAVWKQNRTQLLGRAQDIGVALDPVDDPAELAEDVAALPLIAVRFPSFTDGRGFSTARLLRERYGFKGELRAVGDIFRDQIFFLSRCGFDAFVLRDGEDEQGALAALNEFSEVYQAANDRGPLFDRRFVKG